MFFIITGEKILTSGHILVHSQQQVTAIFLSSQFNIQFCVFSCSILYVHSMEENENDWVEGKMRDRIKTEKRRLAITGCPADCDSCVNSETCTRCRPGLYLHSGRCHHVCPEEFEPNDKVMECTAKGRSHRREKHRQDQSVRSDPAMFSTS